MNHSKALKKLLSSSETLIMPDAYDAISARLIEKSGFKAVQCSGYSFSIAAAKKKEMDMSRSENVEITSRIVEAVDLPVMADAEDGYGNADAVGETVKMFIQAGVAGLNLEDQILDNSKGTHIVSEENMMQKILTARESAETYENPNLIINGRTDALKSTEDREEALNIAVERSNLYLQAGADIAFVTYVETIEEIKTLQKEIKGPLSIAAGMPYNINNFSISDLKELGVTRISLPTFLIYSSLKAIDESLNRLKKDNIKNMDKDLLYEVTELNALLTKY
jgi:2-methylisocitrate lyase-like PEP mutase family enzyme